MNSPAPSFNVRSDEFAIYPYGFTAAVPQPSIVLRVEHQQSVVPRTGRQSQYLQPGSQSLHESLKPGAPHSERYGAPPFLPTVQILRERLCYLGGKEDDERKELKSNKLWESEIRFCHGSKLQHYKAVARYSKRCFALVEKIDDQIKQGKTTITRSKELSQALFLTLYGRSEEEKHSILEKLANQEIKVSEIKKCFPSKESEPTSSEEQRSIATLEQDNKKLHDQIERLKANIKEINDKLMVAERENKRLTEKIRNHLKRKLRRRGNVRGKRKRTMEQSSPAKKKTGRRTEMACDIALYCNITESPQNELDEDGVEVDNEESSQMNNDFNNGKGRHDCNNDDDDEDDVEDDNDDDDVDDYNDGDYDDDDDDDYTVDDDDDDDYTVVDDDDDDYNDESDDDCDDNDVNETQGEVHDDGLGNQKTLWFIPCLP